MEEAEPETPPAPEWLDRWRTQPLPPERALGIFDALDPLAPGDLVGRWRGSGLHTGHPLDGILEAHGWYGKAFRGPEGVDPLLFRRRGGGVFAVDPACIPVGLALRRPALARSRFAVAMFTAFAPLVRTSKPAARLRMVAHRGVPSASMVYDRQPITDHFRRIDDQSCLGLMELRGSPRPFFFLLARDGG